MSDAPLVLLAPFTGIVTDLLTYSVSVSKPPRISISSHDKKLRRTETLRAYKIVRLG